VATVPPTIALCHECFGRERAPVVFGWIFAAHQVGAALAAWGAGRIRDVVGDYQPAFIVAGIACLCAAVAVPSIRGDRSRVHPAPVPAPGAAPPLAPTPAAGGVGGG
jgi:predicted MFS family arabinose efflux permease